MRLTRVLAVTAVAFVCVAIATPASAHGRHRHGPRISLSFGFPGAYYYSPYYYGYYPRAYYPYYAAPVVVTPAAPAYVEQGGAAPQAAPAPGGSWYYCAESNAYYPYVQQCAGGWRQVSPTPPGR